MAVLFIGLVIGLTFLLAVSVVAVVGLVGHLLNVICRRRRQRVLLRNEARSRTEGVRQLLSLPSENLLRSFFPRNQTRIEPTGTPPAVGCDSESELENSMKLKELFGNSRMLFTIKEEEREGMESERSSIAERETKRRISMEESLAEIVITLEFVDEGTPFETPSPSPPYFTPLPSPPRNIEGGSEIPTLAVRTEI